jgi:hypothetical protein
VEEMGPLGCGFVGDRYQKDEEAGVSGRNGPFGLFLLWDASCEIVARTQCFLHNGIVAYCNKIIMV